MDEVKITAGDDSGTTETRSVPKNQWVSRSGLKDCSDSISTQLERGRDTVHEALKKARERALIAWNWKTFMCKGAVTAPSFDLLEARSLLNDPTDSYPYTTEVREALSDKVKQLMREKVNEALGAGTGSGKSYNVATTPWLNIPNVTGERQVIQLSPTQNSRDDAAEDSEEQGRSHRILHSRNEICPICRGDHDPEGCKRTITVDGEPVSKWIAQMCNDKNLSLDGAKTILFEKADQDLESLPCGGEDNKCPVEGQWKEIKDSISDEPEYDVIHATHKFSFVPTLTYENNIVFDEQPSFAEIGPGDPSGGLASDDSMDTNRVKSAVNAFLDDADVGIETAGELMTIAKREAADVRSWKLRDEFPNVYEAFDHRPKNRWYHKHPNAHTDACAFAQLLWDAARQPRDANGRRHAKVIYRAPSLTKTSADREIVNRRYGSVVINDDNRITTLRIGPVLGHARSVLGFDAYPVEELWKLNLGDAMTVEKLISDTERRLWRRHERRLLTVQVGHGAYSYTSDERYDVEKNRVLIETLREQYGEHFRTVIAPSAVEDHVKSDLAGADVNEFNTMHHGDVQSRNDFQGEHIGAVIGCTDPGDDYVLDLLAELDLSASVERQDVPCEVCAGDGCDQCNHSGDQRAFGRGFVGEDREIAEQLLASVRENEVAQAIGRYARKADDPDDWAVVFVRTTAIPDSMADFEGPWVWKYQEKQKAIVEYFQENTRGTAKDIAEWIGSESDTVDTCTKRHVLDTVGRHVKYGNIKKHEGIGYNGADVFEWTAGDLVSKHGKLNFEITEVDHSESQAPTPQPENNVPGHNQIESG